MVKENHLIFGVHITDRIHHVSEVQKLLSEYGCYIKTRLGLHEVSPDFCSPNGLMLLEMFGERAVCQKLFEKLNAIDGVECQSMTFEHDL